MKHTILYLRILGALIIIGGGLLFLYGGKEIPISFYRASMTVPLEYFLVGIGLLLLLLPLLIIYILALILPEKAEKRLLEYADSLDPEIQQLKDSGGHTNFSNLLYSHIHRANKRSYTFIFIAVLFIFVILPLLVSNAISKSQLKRESERLVSLVQETRIDYGSSDHVREHLHQAEGVMPSKQTATRSIYDVLKNLYNPSIKNRDAFNKAVIEVYNARIKPNVTEVGLLNVDKFDMSQESAEAELAPATYLTLLAIICNNVADHGKYDEPYMQGRQLLRLALSKLKNTDKAPSTHNTSGVNFAGLLKTYPSLVVKFRNEQTARDIQSSLDIKGIPSQLSLLRQAKDEYLISEQQSSTNLAKARSINNQIDALLTFIHRIHVDKQFVPEMMKDDTDRHFMENEIGMKMPEKVVNPQKLTEILNRYRDNIDAALDLTQTEAEFYFTRAQVLSVGGQLAEKYKLADSFWSASDNVAKEAISSLSTASSMQLPDRYFSEEEKTHFLLEWLWTRQQIRPQLEQLAR